MCKYNVSTLLLPRRMTCRRVGRPAAKIVDCARIARTISDKQLLTKIHTLCSVEGAVQERRDHEQDEVLGEQHGGLARAGRRAAAALDAGGARRARALRDRARRRRARPARGLRALLPQQVHHK